MINKVKLVQLHEPLFLAGVNFGNKLIEKTGKGDLKLTHDSETDHVLVEFKGERSHIKNWASFNEDTGIKEEQPRPIIVHNPSIKAQFSGPEKPVFTAQVSTPLDKVQGKPGRKARYQGEESQGE